MGLASLGRRGGDFGDEPPPPPKEALLGYVIMRADGLMVTVDLLSVTPELSEACVFPTKVSAKDFFDGFEPKRGETWNVYEVRTKVVK